ncbi:MAG: glycosyltransferase family 4 protein [Patescibacteria group bacterium]|nr:glycosyltransferase family 4 protein [Patescibacteria group bacterium]
MKLLIITQKVNRNDPILGFFHRWIEEFAKKFESIVVICLEKGEYNLPQNVRVLSLGKEDGRSRLKYVWRFYKYILKERNNYDKVFVHMNEEYVILGGIIWKILGKKVAMWRNHLYGNFQTDLACVMCDKVFCTSKYSYSAKFSKTVIMPVGIDTETFKDFHSSRVKNSLLMLGRISPVKKPDVFVKALIELNKRGVDFTASVVGDALRKDKKYYDSIKEQIESGDLSDRVTLVPAVSNDKTPEIYNRHELFVNLTPSGSFDKTILEAAACGCKILVMSRDAGVIFGSDYVVESDEPGVLATKLSGLISTKVDIDELRRVVIGKHDLPYLSQRLLDELS